LSRSVGVDGSNDLDTLEFIVPARSNNLKQVNRSSSKLASVDPLLEEVVKIGKATVLGLRKEEEDPDSPDEAKAEVKHSSLGSPVPGIAAAVEHTGVELLDDDLTTDVDGTADDDGLGSDTAGGGFGDDDVGGGTKRDLENTLDNDKEGSSSDGYTVTVGSEAEDTNDQHACADSGRAPEVECTTTNSTHKGDGNSSGKDVDRLDTHVVIESVLAAHADGLEQDSSETGDGLTVENLDDPGHADDTSSAGVGSTEAVHETSILGLNLFHLVGVLHKSKRISLMSA
jgi:hypothetical protein